MTDDARPWRRSYIARHWTITCLSRRCLNCTCGYSIEIDDNEGVDVRDDYDLTS
jgi:hypothetical protein